MKTAAIESVSKILEHNPRERQGTQQRVGETRAPVSDPIGLEMPLTPEEIANKRFHASFRGYSKWEVEQFLLDVAIDYRRAIGLAQWAMERPPSGAAAPPPPPPLGSAIRQAAPAEPTYAPLTRTPSQPTSLSATSASRSASATVRSAPQGPTAVPVAAAALDQGVLTTALTTLNQTIAQLTAQLATIENRLTQLEAGGRTSFGNPAAPSMYGSYTGAATTQLRQPVTDTSWWPKESPIALVRRN